MTIKNIKQYLLTPFMLLVLLPYTFAQSELTPVTKTFAIKDAHIIQKPGQVLEVGTVVIKDGLIHAVGRNVAIPPNAKVLAADSMFVYAGFIDGLSHTGIPKPEAKAGTSNNRRQKDAANPSYEKAGIQPQLQVRDLLNPKDKAIAEMRKLGYTAAHVVPRGNMLPGGGSLILLNGEKTDDFIYKDQVALFAQLKGAGGVFPATLIAVMSKFRELYQQAEQAKVYEQAYQRNPLGKQRPEQDRVLQAFYPTIDKKQPVFFSAPAVKDMHRVFTLQKELGFPVVLTDVKQGWHLADKIKSTRTPVLLSLNLPKDKSKKAAKDKEGKKKEADKKEGEKKKKASKKEKKKPVSKELMAFQERQKAALKQYNAQAATFQDKNIPFGFTAISTKAGDIRTNLRTMIKNGLKESTALAALTTVPAQQLGVSQSMGTIEKGKLANLVITDKPYFEEKSAVRFVLVDGQVFKYEPKKKKKSGAKTSAKIAGTWNYSIAIPDVSAAGVLTIKEEAGNISGSITNEMADDGPEDIQAAEIDGNELSFQIQVNDNGDMAEVTVTIKEDTMEGTIMVPGMGTFDLEGERVPE